MKNNIVSVDLVKEVSPKEFNRLLNFLKTNDISLDKFVMYLKTNDVKFIESSLNNMVQEHLVVYWENLKYSYYLTKSVWLDVPNVIDGELLFTIDDD